MKKLLLIALLATVGLNASQCGNDYAGNTRMAATANCHAREANDIAKDRLAVEKEQARYLKVIADSLKKIAQRR